MIKLTVTITVTGL